MKERDEKLIRVAAQREIISTEKLFVTEDYKSFSGKFPFQLTDYQARAINDGILDLETGKLMARLNWCDVGVGKTEVAVRISFSV